MWSSPLSFLVDLMIALLAAMVWELLLRDRVLRWRSSRRLSSAWRIAFPPGKAYYISKSSVVTEAFTKRSFRDTDVFVEAELVARGAKKLNDDPCIDLNHPAENLIVIGGPRYNAYADRLQRHFAMKQEYVIDSYDVQPAREILKVVSEYGDVHGSSVDLKTSRPKPDIDYGILLVAVAKNGKTIYWISGIHGEGTIGVMKYLMDHPLLLQEGLAAKAESGTSWLLRVEYETSQHKEPSFDIIKKVELVGESHQCVPRSFDRTPKALVCDFGNVIMLFDRSLAYRAIGQAVGIDHGTVKSRIEESGLQGKYEQGELSDHEFYERVLALFPGATAMPYDVFCASWSNIFSPNRNMIEALRKLSREVTLVLLSNTNNLDFSMVREQYPDVLSMFGDRLVLSYREKVSKPAGEIFRRAVQQAGAGVTAADCVYVDDRLDYVEAARKAGMKALVYNSHPQFVFWLRRYGLHVPQSAEGELSQRQALGR